MVHIGVDAISVYLYWVGYYLNACMIDYVNTVVSVCLSTYTLRVFICKLLVRQ